MKEQLRCKVCMVNWASDRVCTMHYASSGGHVKASSPQSWQQMQLDVEIRYSAWSSPSSERSSTTTLDREAQIRCTTATRPRIDGSLNGNGVEVGTMFEGDFTDGLKSKSWRKEPRICRL